MRHRIGECLLKTGLITQDDLQTALAEQERTGERLGIVMTRLNRATERQIAETLAAQLGFSFVDLAEHPPDPKVVSVIPRELAQTHACVAVSLDGSVLRLAMADPLIFSLVQELEAETGYDIKPVVAARGDIRRVIQEGYPEMGLLHLIHVQLAARKSARKRFRSSAFSTASSRLPRDAG